MHSKGLWRPDSEEFSAHPEPSRTPAPMQGGALHHRAFCVNFWIESLPGSMICQTGSYMLGAAVTGRALRRIPATRLIPVGVVLGVAAGLWLAIGLALMRPSFIGVMGPVAI